MSIECTLSLSLLGALLKGAMECLTMVGFPVSIFVCRMYIVLVVARSPVERCHGVSDDGGVPSIFYVQKLIKVVDDEKCMVMSHM